jgi:hypothetical protein
VAASELDASYLKQREGGRIVSVAAIIPVAVNTDGRREIVGLHIGPSEAKTFWSSFLKSLARRGLRGIKLVISDAHEGLSGDPWGIRRLLAALPRALDAQRSGLCAEDPAEHGNGGAAPALLRLSPHNNTIVLPFATQIKRKSRTPVQDRPLKAEVTFCVQGVISTLLLNELDRERDRRGHRFVRYADDCVPRTR